ncbi:MAG: S-adenosylmethionine hydrolase [Planctomycetota bacterium]|jgi:S-adenosylmethionine hydrolase
MCRLSLSNLGLAFGLVVWTACASVGRVDTDRPAVVYITDFGLRDGAVSAMKGVARGVDPGLVLEDLSHEIKPFDVWEAAYRLTQTAPYWPNRTVFVCVIDPGVGTSRKSVVAKTKNGKLFVTPDNGTLTLVQDQLGFVEVREISAAIRLPGSEQSSTFHGRDVYSLTGALLASGELSFEAIGPVVDSAQLIRFEYPVATVSSPAEANGVTRWKGMIPVLDPNFGNVWTNIPANDVSKLLGDRSNLSVTIHRDTELVYSGQLPWARSFGEVPLGSPLLYSNSLGDFAIALNQGSFAAQYEISAGPNWLIQIETQP